MQDKQVTKYFKSLRKHDYINLTTYRESGEPVTTPVWFVQDDYRIYVVTFESTGKAKRIRNNPRVEIASCTRTGRNLGEPVAGNARILSRSEASDAERLLKAKYRLMQAFLLINAVRGKEQVYLSIMPDIARTEAK